MLTAYSFSQRITMLRMHRWALDRGLSVNDCFAQLSEFDKIIALCNILLNDALKESNFKSTVEHQTDHQQFRVELPDVAALVDRACVEKHSFAATYFPPLRKERPFVTLRYYDAGLWVLAQQVQEFINDLRIYKALELELSESTPSKTSAEDELKAEFTRNLQWIRQARLARADTTDLRATIQELIAANTPQGTVRVEVTEGQSLQDAIFAALRSAPSSETPTPNPADVPFFGEFEGRGTTNTQR